MINESNSLDEEARLKRAFEEHCENCERKRKCGERTPKGRSYEVAFFRDCSLSIHRVLYLEELREEEEKKNKRRRDYDK
jgi:hypothetical protein